MAILDAMREEFIQEAVQTRKVLERLPNGNLGWKPHEKSMTFSLLGGHLAEMAGWGAEVITTNESSYSMAEYKPFMPESVAELLAAFDANCEKLVNAMQDRDDAYMMQPWRLIMDGQVLFELPRVAALRAMIFNHTIHHRGQLTVYLRLNDIPVPAIYGPSADEQS